MASDSQFLIIGARLSNIDFSEKRIREAQDRYGSRTVSIEVSVEFLKPIVSEDQFNGRKVIELKYRINVSTNLDEDSKSDGIALCRIQSTSGFVGSATEDDGNLDAFLKDVSSYNKQAYLASLEYIRRVLGMTPLKSVSLPWSVVSKEVEKSVTKKGKVTAKQNKKPQNEGSPKSAANRRRANKGRG